MYDYVFPTITLSQYQTTANVDIYIPSSGSEIGGQTFELILSTHDSRVAVIDPYADALRVYIVGKLYIVNLEVRISDVSGPYVQCIYIYSSAYTTHNYETSPT